MQSKETQKPENQITQSQTAETENNVSSDKKTPEPDYMNPQKPNKPEPITQIQKDNVITKQDIPDLKFRVGVTLVILIIFLFVGAIYYGIINP